MEAKGAVVEVAMMAYSFPTLHNLRENYRKKLELRIIEYHFGRCITKVKMVIIFSWLQLNPLRFPYPQVRSFVFQDLPVQQLCSFTD